MTDSIGRQPATLAAQALGRIDERTGALVPGIEPATTFLRDPDGGYSSGRIYGRADNPTYDLAENLLSELEGGAATLLFASGMAAATAVFQALSPGDHVVVPRVMYWALRGWLLGPCRPLGSRGRAGRHDRPCGRRRRGAAGADPPDLAGDAGQPLVGDQRHRGRGRDRAPGRRTAGGRFDRRHAGADPAAGPGCRPRHARGDQVPERALRRDRGLADHRVSWTSPGRGFARSGHSRAASSAASRRGSCCAGCAPCSCACGTAAARHRHRPSGSRSTRWWPRCSIPACRRSPGMRWPPGRCGAGSAACCRSACVAARRRR